MTEVTEMIDKDGKSIKGTIVPDGGRLRVPVQLMDSAPNIAAITRAAMADAERPQAAMHRPGSLPMADADRAARDKALSDREQRLVDAWKNPAARRAPLADATQRTTPAAVSDVAEVNAAWARKQARLASAWKMGGAK